MPSEFLSSAIKQFEYYKLLGDKTLAQVPDEGLFWQYNSESNSIATIIQHLWGNMLSRWTDFRTTDGEKEWRNRDAEFEQVVTNRATLLEKWNAGWDCLFAALHSLEENDLDALIYIRNQGHTLQEAILRQLAHYPYHIGQLVFVGKMIVGEGWASLSIPKGNSQQFNDAKFSQEKKKAHFTDEVLKEKGK
jgi:hypothetical protein